MRDLADKLLHAGVVACEVAFVGMVLTFVGYVIVIAVVNFAAVIGWGLVGAFAVLLFGLVAFAVAAKGKPKAVDHFRDFRGEP